MIRTLSNPSEPPVSGATEIESPPLEEPAHAGHHVL